MRDAMNRKLDALAEINQRSEALAHRAAMPFVVGGVASAFALCGVVHFFVFQWVANFLQETIEVPHLLERALMLAAIVFTVGPSIVIARRVSRSLVRERRKGWVPEVCAKHEVAVSAVVEWLAEWK